MWSPNVPLVRVGLSLQGLSIARLPRFGLGLGMGLSLARQAAVEYLPVAPAASAVEDAAGVSASAVVAAAVDVSAPWRAAVDTLAQWLAAHKSQRLQVQVLLAGRLARWQLLPWRAELSSADEQAAYATLRFKETYGRAVQDWQVLPAIVSPGNTAPAAAVDRALIEALGLACSCSGATLQSVTPYFSSAFDAWCSRIKGPAAWFGTVEADTLTLGLLQGGQWTALQTQRFAGDWRSPMQALMVQIAQVCGVPVAADAPPLYLAGDIATPNTTHSATGPAFVWLQPQPLSTPTPPGLRLAMGC